MEATDAEKLAEFTKVWKTIGLEDRSVETHRTVTMRPPSHILEADQRRSLPRLPRLLSRDEQSAMPELRLKQKLGEGGMGVVNLATQLPMGRDVAVKCLRDEARTRQMRLGLLREGWTTGLLEHPNIVPVYTLGRDEAGEPMIVMKRIGGVAWSELLYDPSKAPREFDSADPLDWHIEILMQVCNAVHYAHSKGVIHRDLKPENVMIGEFGEVYVLDWGIAISLEDEPDGRLPTRGDVTSPAGTPAYMAPEMVLGEGDKLSERTDIYLLGAMLHEILTGRPPHRGSTLYETMFAAFASQPHEYDETVPQTLADICHKAMAAEPADRFESASEFRHALADFKRHREALALADEATRRLDALREMLSNEGAEPASEAQVYKLFGECRFGFEQALRVETDNRTAREGLQAVLEMMAERELERSAYQAASLLIADLPEPRPELEARLEELGVRLESREQEFEALRKIQRETNVEIGRGSRSILAFSMGLAFCIFGLLMEAGDRWWGIPFSHELMVGRGVVLILAVIGVMLVWRRWLFRNSVNRRIMLGLLTMLGGSVLYRIIVWINDFPVLPALSGEVLYFGICGAILGFAQDRRILWGSVPYVIAGVLCAIYSPYAMIIFSATNLLALTLIAWVLWPSDSKK